MSTELTPFALAALAPILVLAVYLVLRTATGGRRSRQGSNDAPRVPPEPAVEGHHLTPVVGPAPIAVAARVDEPARAAERVSVVNTGASRHIDRKVVDRYAGPTATAWERWWRKWQAQLVLDGPGPAIAEAILESFLGLARPIVVELDPNPDSADADAAASALRAINVHPDRYTLIQDQWFILELSAQKAGVAIDPQSRRWQVAPPDIVAGTSTDRYPGDRRRLMAPERRVSAPRIPVGVSASVVARALAIDGLAETCGLGIESAARVALTWAGHEDVSDDEARSTAAAANVLCQSLGLVRRTSGTLAMSAEDLVKSARSSQWNRSVRSAAD